MQSLIFLDYWATTNLQRRRGLTIWGAGEKAGESRFFHFRGAKMAGAAAKPALRTRVYVDGYNLYYGCLKNTPHKWLDLLTLFANHIIPASAPARSELLPLGIKFFTAKILEKAAKASDSISSQARYHTALFKMHDGRIQLIEGYYSRTSGPACARKYWYGNWKKSKPTSTWPCKPIMTQLPGR
jgi:hypothetical protein